MRTLLILIGLVTVLGVAPSGMAGPGASSGTLTVHTSRYGSVLFDGHGFALYTFSHDPRGRSSCSGACAKAWPPLIVKRAPSAGAGAKASLLGTLRRSDGTTAWWVPLLGDRLVCLTTLAVDSVNYGGAITVATDPSQFDQDPFARIFPGTVVETDIFCPVAPPAGPVVERYSGVAWPGGRFDRV